jgi:hypothetical protein
MGYDPKEEKRDTPVDHIDPDEVAAAAAAVKETVNTFTYMGIPVGMYVTDEECKQVATAAITAAKKYRNAPSI